MLTGPSHIAVMPRPAAQFYASGLLLGAVLLLAIPARATILWSDPDARVVHETGKGVDILGGKVKRDDKASDALYFKFHVDPISDVDTEPYFAGFQLFEGGQERLGVGNALEAWGYSAFNTAETGPSNHDRRRIQLQLRASRTGQSGPVLALRIGAPRPSSGPSFSKFNMFPAATTS